MSDALALWERATAPDFIRALTDGRLPASPHFDHLGVVVAAVEPGHVVLDWTPGERLRNAAGIVHGGYVSVVVDDAGGLACAALGERFRPMLTLDLHVDFLRPVHAGVRHRAVGRVVHPGRLRMVAEAHVTDADDRLVARASGAFTPNTAFDPAAYRPGGGR